jgi:hypothetical protein
MRRAHRESRALTVVDPANMPNAGMLTCITFYPMSTRPEYATIAHTVATTV